MDTITVERLGLLGFGMAAKRLADLKEKKRKMAIAYEHYRFVRQEKIDAFNFKLRKESQDKNGPFSGYKTLTFTPTADYDQVPPLDVLALLATAQERKCFDAFEVAHIVAVKDPILFGRVKGCTDRFFIGQWDDDIKISDLLKDNEG